MNGLKSVVRFGVLALLSCFSLLSADTGISGYQTLSEKQTQYSFKAWPVGASAPIHFKSALYLKESASYVRIDEGNLFPKQDESPVRRVTDFDSLKIFAVSQARAVTTPQGPSYVRDTLWYPAHVVGKVWVFLKVPGRVALYTLRPGRGAYRGMDTGAGVMAYSEKALRAKIVQSPRAAKLLREEKIGHTVAWSMGLGGLGLAAIGTATNLVSDGNGGNPFVFAGLGIAVFSWIPHLMVADRFEAAIKAYNQDSTQVAVPR
jgi:hypothetical protein